MKRILNTLLWLVIATNTLSAEELKLKSFFDGKMELKIPGYFEPMTEEILKFKYPSPGRPTLVYTNEEANANVAVNLLVNRASQAQIEGYKNILVANFEKLFPSAKWKSTGVTVINGRKVGYMELITPAIDTDIYNLMFFTDMDGRLLLCTFNCVIKDIEKWQVPAKEIMNSLRIK